MGRKEREKKAEEMKNTVTRVRMPYRNEGEMFGLVLSTLGGARMLVICEDGKERICRVPGKIKKSVWVKEGDHVILKPWEIEGDKKGDIVWRYRELEVNFLRNRGMLKFLDSS